ncbi:MAG: OadG family protein [Anaerovoracaceae bacterium]|jgi:sodium pump decarboxylase gamma subunit
MTLGEILETALVDTLLGMGTVFLILIIIALIIKCFDFFPFLKEGTDTKAAAKKQNAEVPEPESAEADLSGDEQLVAVITAAICAYNGESETSGGGYVVRRIRRSTWKHTLSE